MIPKKNKKSGAKILTIQKKALILQSQIGNDCKAP